MTSIVQFWCSLKVVAVTVCINLRETKTQPYSVTTFPELDDLYLQLRIQNVGIAPQKLTLQSKWSVCAQIFRRRTDFVQSIYALIHPLECRDELEDDDRYRHIFDEIFEPVATEGVDVSAPGPSRRYEYTNATRAHKISVNGIEYTEYVFTCLTVRRPYDDWRSAPDDYSPTFRQYYVSHDHYNVNEVPDRNPILGRFVFSYNEQQDNVVLHALAEEYAQMLSHTFRTEIDFHYIAQTGRAVSNAENDPICQLNYGRRLRLCSSLVKRLRWAAVRFVVDQRCERLEFFMNNGTARSTEWMIYCRTRGTIRLTYRISRSYTDNEVFLYQDSIHGLELVNCFRNIGVVRDRPVNSIAVVMSPTDERVDQGAEPSVP